MIRFGTNRILGVLAGLALAVGVVAVATAGGGSSYTKTSPDSRWLQTATTNGPVGTNSKSFKRIPGAMARRPAAEPDGLSWFQSVTVTATVILRKGSAKLRVVNGPDEFDDTQDGALMYPRTVKISGKGPHTVDFILAQNEDYIFPPELQWKRIGKKPVKARTVVTAIQGNVD